MPKEDSSFGEKAALTLRPGAMSVSAARSPRQEALLVRGILRSPENCEKLEMYFGSTKRSGGGEVEEVVPFGEDRVRVVFSEEAEPGGKSFIVQAIDFVHY